MHRRLALFAFIALQTATAPAADMELDGMAVTGNQELPKSLTIVPWKGSELGDIAGLPTGSLLNEHLQPVQREVFRRELRYYDSVHGTE
jgi:hypothetical protein